jgi:hypothetical protein
VIEADIHSYRGAVEVRHLKTMRGLPLLWDRWKLAPGWRGRLSFFDLATAWATSPGPAVMLDLKGEDVQLPTKILAAIEEMRSVRRVLVCGQNWRQLDQLLDVPGIDVLHSIGSKAQLDAYVRSQRAAAGVSIHLRLLSHSVANTLKQRVPFIITWPVNGERSLHDVVGFGVDGVTTDRDEIIVRIAMARSRTGLSTSLPTSTEAEAPLESGS